MANLKYKTRGDSNPRGKPKVWFCAHPEDYEEYFTPIKDELLKHQNCVVYYDADPLTSSGAEKLLADLAEMKLFVMPVTTKLLTTKNRAIDVELAFAMEAHIPVLPLMQEEGLDELFNRRCGNLQYLNKNNVDAMAIGYEEKLEKYLASVLLGDELAAKIRAAFDAYIFLSYRKKDRAYARELMRLIHENDFCQDIAIWYDEYLVPGENFNDSIELALKDCELFALAVTPNLLEDGNYVMDVEYKRARESKKPIFPAEVAPTDRAELEKKFGEIPPCTNAHDKKELSKSLKDALSRIVLRANDKDDKHNFFIGLAYLSGIDVEVDHARALAMIRASAEGGLPEAMKKLVQMYRDGEGVARNHALALEWQEKYVTYLRNACVTGVGNTGDYLDELLALVDYCTDLHETRRAQESCIEFLREAGNHTSEGHYYREMVLRGYDRLGDLFYALGELKKAYAYYKQCAWRAQAMAMEHRDGDLGYYTVIAQNKMGDSYLAKGALGLAEEHYGTAWTTSLSLISDPPEPRGLHCAIQSYRKMGQLHRAFGEPEEAIPYFEEALDFAGQLCEIDASGESQREMAECAIALGEAALADRKQKQAREYFETAHRYATVYYQEKITFSSRQLLALCEEKLGDLCVAEKNRMQANVHYETALQQLRALAEETNTVGVRQNLLSCLLRGASSLQGSHKLMEAEVYLTEAHGIAVALREENDVLRARQDLCLCEESLGELYLQRKDLARAKEHYKKAVSLRKKIKRGSEVPAHTHELAASYAGLAETCRGLKRHYYRHRARFLEKRITWRCPNVAEYREQLSDVEEKLHISSKLNFRNVSTVVLGNLLWLGSEIWYNYFNLPANWIYWLMAAPGMLLTILGLHRIFEPSIMAKYQKKMREKRREDRTGYLSALGDELTKLLFWTTALALIRVLLIEWIS